MQVTFYEGSIGGQIKDLGKYDVIFTIAVLEHLHSDSESVFAEIAKQGADHGRG